MKASSSNKIYDVAVFGGGLSGWASAYALCVKGYSVCVVERTVPARPSIGEHLPPEGVLAVARLGLSELLSDPAHRPSSGVNMCWGNSAAYRRSYFSHPGGQGWHLDRAIFDAAVRGKAMALGCDLFTAGSLAIDGKPEEWEVGTTSGSVNARLLVDATGRAAALAKTFGTEVERQDSLVGLAVSTGMDRIGSELLLDAVPDGWLYAAPLADQRGILVALTDADLLPKSKRARQSWWTGCFQNSRLAEMVTGKPDVESMRIVPAWSQRQSVTATKGMVAVGDAAMAFDPLSSGGMTKALTDAAELAEVIAHEENLDALEARRNIRYAGYRSELAKSYASEQRFAGLPFWQRRHQSA